MMDFRGKYQGLLLYDARGFLILLWQWDQAIRNWLEQIPQGRREAIICDLFSVLEATDAVTLTELQDGGIKNIRVIMKAVEAMDTDSKGVVQDLLKEILQNVPQMLGIKELANLAKRK